MAYLHIYKANPTAGGTDGSLVSEGTGSNPISIGPLQANNNEVSVAQVLAVRCDTGYVTAADVIITPTGASALLWALSADNISWGAYGEALTITAAIAATNTLFYVKARTVEGETPADDLTVTLHVTCAAISAA